MKSVRSFPKEKIIIVALFIVLIFVAILSLGLGRYDLNFGDVIHLLINNFKDSSSVSAQENAILFSIRWRSFRR